MKDCERLQDVAVLRTNPHPQTKRPVVFILVDTIIFSVFVLSLHCSKESHIAYIAIHGGDHQRRPAKNNKSTCDVGPDLRYQQTMLLPTRKMTAPRNSNNNTVGKEIAVQFFEGGTAHELHDQYQISFQRTCAASHRQRRTASFDCVQFVMVHALCQT